MKNNKYTTFLILGVMAVLILIVAFLGINQRNSAPSNTSLGEYSTTITGVRLASAKNALDGSGDFTEEQCNKLGELAKRFNASAEYLACTSPKSIYLSTPDTSEKYVLTLSDDTYTATFITDKNFDNLLDYNFARETSAGFNSYGGRK